MVYSKAEVLALLNTRIQDFNVAPQRAVVDEGVSIAGKLQWKSVWWTNLGKETVKLVVDGEVVETQVTGTDTGAFKFTWYPRAKGIYWVKVRYDGTLIYNPCESPEVKVEAITEEEAEEEEQRTLILAGVGIGSVVLVIIGVALYMEERQRRTMMLAMM